MTIPLPSLSKLQFLVATHLIAVGFGALCVFGVLREQHARDQAQLASALNENVRLTRDRDTLRVALAHEDFARSQAHDSATRYATAVSRQAAVVVGRVDALPTPALPHVQLTPSADSVCLAAVDWHQHLADDSTRDSLLVVTTTILRQGIPAIRDLYETALAKDSVAIVARDSLIANAEARAALWQRAYQVAQRDAHVQTALHVLEAAAGMYVTYRLGVAVGAHR